jgi:hypothetical protein
MLTNLQLKIGETLYPNKAYSTVSARYLQEQLIISDLDGALQATDSYTASIVNLRNNPDTGARWNNSLTDDTDFLALFQTERGDAGYTFDGLDMGAENINTEIVGHPIFKELNDTYYYPAVNAAGAVKQDKHPPPPQVWLCKDTFWVHDGETFTYHHDETPRGSQVPQ